MRNYIFNINDTERELEERLDSKKWPLNPKTQFVDDLVKGDRIVIYEAGEGKHRFVGTAIVKSLSKNKSGNRFVDIEEIEKWPKPLSIKNFFGKLDIIKNPSHYGAYLAGGIKKLSDKDYALIISQRLKK